MHYAPYKSLLAQLELRRDVEYAIKGLFPPYERGSALTVEYHRWLEVGIKAVRRELEQ